jgi:DNA repair protein RadC
MQSLEQVSNVELLSSLTGPKPAEALLRRYGGLTALARAPMEELCQLQGVGPSKAAAIRSAFLLAQRLSRESYTESPVIDSPERVANLMRDELSVQTVEQFRVVSVNTRRRVIGVDHTASGILDQVLVHAREVFGPAILRKASAIILVHNHPSGDPTPSEADIRITRDLVRIGHLMRIEVLDHVIVGHRTTERPRDFSSLRELGHFAGSGSPF